MSLIHKQPLAKTIIHYFLHQCMRTLLNKLMKEKSKGLTARNGTMQSSGEFGQVIQNFLTFTVVIKPISSHVTFELAQNDIIG